MGVILRPNNQYFLDFNKKVLISELPKELKTMGIKIYVNGTKRKYREVPLRYDSLAISNESNAALPLLYQSAQLLVVFS